MTVKEVLRQSECCKFIIQVRATCPAHILFIHLIAAKIMKLLIIQPSPPSCLLFPLSTKYPPGPILTRPQSK
jgi:hypothetical protein